MEDLKTSIAFYVLKTLLYFEYFSKENANLANKLDKKINGENLSDVGQNIKPFTITHVIAK